MSIYFPIHALFVHLNPYTCAICPPTRSTHDSLIFRQSLATSMLGAMASRMDRLRACSAAGMCRRPKRERATVATSLNCLSRHGSMPLKTEAGLREREIQHTQNSPRSNEIEGGLYKGAEHQQVLVRVIVLP